jgi:cytosine/adenosine deaminase-related metal-dependent hydrolase
VLVISEQHMAALHRTAVVRFENEMVAHSLQFAPKLAKVIGEEQLRRAIRAATARAQRHGFTHRGPVRLFIEAMFLFGSAFDDDPQYPWARTLLQADVEQMARAHRLYEKILDYQHKVSGPEGANTREALRRLAQLGQRPPAPSHGSVEDGMMWELANVFPEKAAYAGKEALRGVAAEGIAAARKAGFETPRSQTVVVMLMYTFGHGCGEDLLYPWIARTLHDPRIADPAVRADRLERKALTWLSHVLAGQKADVTS